MIYLLVGENIYKAEQELARLLRGRETVERFDAAEIDESQLSDIVRGMSLFSLQRTVIVRGLSEAKELWDKLAEWTGDVPEDTLLILREPKLDKRLKATKDIMTHSKLVAADHWTDRDTRLAEEWARKLAQEKNMKLSGAQITDIVQRASVPTEKPGAKIIDQMQTAQALSALSVLDEITDDAIAAVLPPAPGEVVFRLLEKAVARDTAGVQRMLELLHAHDDPYRSFAGVVKQWLQLVAVKMAGAHSDALGIHPFMLGKLKDQARQVNSSDTKAFTELAATLDVRMKLSEITPWEGFDRFIMAVTLR